MAKQAEYVRYTIRVPADLYERIKVAAGEKSVNAEIVEALELAYPILRPQQQNLRLFHFQWYAGEWYAIDEDSWARFRAGDIPSHLARRMQPKNNHFIVAVVDEEVGLVNLISHNYHLKDGSCVLAADDYLSDQEKADYAWLMKSPTATEDDEQRLKSLREKMHPAFALPSAAVPKLKDILKGLASEDALDQLLNQIGSVEGE